MPWWSSVHVPDPAGLLEILVLSVMYYYVILFFRGTRAAQVLTGIVVSLLALVMLTQVFRLDVLNWLIKRFFLYLAVAFVIVFQPEIRRALAELGRQPMFGSTRAERTLVERIVQAAVHLAERKIGALIAVEREIGLRAIQETGIALDSVVTPELLASIFFPHTPLHDGGVIIRGNRIVAARCVFPLSARPELSKTLGTRHRAAIGLTEETDAVVVVVSEETGTVSVAYRGRLSRGVDEERLRRFLAAVLTRGRRGTSGPLARAKAHLDVDPESLARTEAPANQEGGHGA